MTSLTLRPAPSLRPNPASASPPSSASTLSQSPVCAGTGSTSGGGGPLVGTFVVPPRPKPGRKAATEVPPTKRKQQNREAQRSFRARRQQQREILEQEAAASRREKDECRQLLEIATHSVARHEKTISALQQKCTAAEASILHLNAEMASLRTQLSQASRSIKTKDELIEQLKEQIGSRSRPRSGSPRSLQQQQQQQQQQLQQSLHLRTGRTNGSGSSHHLSYTSETRLTDGHLQISIHPSSLHHDQSSVQTSSPLLSSVSEPGSDSLTPLDNRCTTCAGSPCMCMTRLAASTIASLEGRTSTSSSSELPHSSLGGGDGVAVATLLAATSYDSTLTPVLAPSHSIGYEDREIDFTNFIKPFPGSMADESPSTVAIGLSEDMPESCGFCTDTTNCICRAKATEMLSGGGGGAGIDGYSPSRPQAVLPAMTDAVVAIPVPGVLISSVSAPSPLKDGASATSNSTATAARRRPGTCPQCQANPEQKRFCEELSRRRSPAAEGRRRDGEEGVSALQSLGGMRGNEEETGSDRKQVDQLERPVKRARVGTGVGPSSSALSLHPPSDLSASLSRRPSRPFTDPRADGAETQTSRQPASPAAAGSIKKISCADAYRLSKQPQIQHAWRTMNYGEMYKIYKDMKSPDEREAEREEGVKAAGGAQRFSAFEIDIGEALTVMASMGGMAGANGGSGAKPGTGAGR